MRFRLMAVALAAAVGAGVFVLPAAAQDTSNYCGVVASISGEQVATGYWYTESDGSHYCRPIGDSASYVCLDADGRLPTRTEQRDVEYREYETVTHTFYEVVERPAPFYFSSFLQDAWTARFTPEIVAVYETEAGEAIPGAPAWASGKLGWVIEPRSITVSGDAYVTLSRKVDVVSTVLSHNNDGSCPPDAAEHGRAPYDTLPLSPPTQWADYDPTIGDGANDDDPTIGDGANDDDPTIGDATFERHAATDAISTHSDGTNMAHTQFVHICVSNGGVLTSGSCVSRTPDPPESTPTIYTCYAQNYVTEPRLSNWDPIITKPVGDPVPYESMSPCLSS